jgi:glycosyltransferase involved in cell wall biosynthesis
MILKMYSPTDAGGIPEIVRHDFNGLTAPAGNPEKLAHLAERLMLEPALAERLVTNAKEFVKDFSKENMADRTLAIYQDVLRTR